VEYQARDGASDLGAAAGDIERCAMPATIDRTLSAAHGE
jgi:hypothetical protein